MEEPQSHFVADTNFFIQGTGIVQAPHTIYTSHEVIEEIRDQRSKQIFENFKLLHEVIVKEPSQESVDIVTQTATDSGNIVLLSPTDIHLIALALDFQPPPQEGAEEEQAPEAPAFDEWITVENFGKVDQTSSSILCTSDATMQCVAMMLKITVVSSNGMPVAEVKRWLMRCSCCYAETMDATKEFCPECGQHTLVRYALVMRAGVEKELPLPRRFWPTSKGKRYTIPSYKGGRHAGKPNIILSEDMLMVAKKKYHHVKKTQKETEATATNEFFLPRKKATPAPSYGYGNQNPNVPKHLTGRKKKDSR